MKFSSLTDRVRGSAADVWDSHYAAVAAQRRGEDVIVLSVGDPDFSTPPEIIEAAVRALHEGDTHYTEVIGIDKLREAIAQQHQQNCGQDVSRDNVAVTSGAQNALFATSLCLAETGDEMIVLQPMYVTYEATVQASGATLVPVVLDAKSGFKLDADSLRAAITNKTRAIFYASPSNPTGIMLTRDELQAIADVAIEHDLWVVADEVYADIVFESEFHHMAALPGMAERTVTISSLSKSYAMTGWRVGWAVGPTALIRNLEKLSLCMLYGLPGFIQQAGYYALKNAGKDRDAMRDIYRQRRDLLLREFESIPELKALKPDAGMFLMVDVRGTGLSAPDFVQQLYQYCGVSVLDATAFGASAEGFVRISYTIAEADLLEASRRIRAFIESLRRLERLA
ncbi:MAG: aminotransferase class I/II-fold pyridoxal phosphate-dependent enzyme [Proteobacteria bacterium]|nr:aminotransferase class I/II-fold pyridoxal phosphate-dependent enzyme [Pseudomonadota bacterium]